MAYCFEWDVKPLLSQPQDPVVRVTVYWYALIAELNEPNVPFHVLSRQHAERINCLGTLCKQRSEPASVMALTVLTLQPHDLTSSSSLACGVH